jgi:methylmalonyl-CoA mutase C-terminal domain/subunit
VRASYAPRILLAKPGLDGHDRGVKVVAMALRDQGFDVIYLGLRQSAESILDAAAQEDVDAIGISVLSGVHLAISRRLLDLRLARGQEDIPVFIGGTIPKKDAIELLKMGVSEVFPVGTGIDDVVKRVQAIVVTSRDGS